MAAKSPIQMFLIGLIYKHYLNGPGRRESIRQRTGRVLICLYTRARLTSIHRKIPTKFVPPGTRYSTYYIKSPPVITDHCWRCLMTESSFLQIWWTCPRLGPYWTEMHDIVTQVTREGSRLCMSQYMLNHLPLSVQTYKKFLLKHMINAARLCVPVHWMDTLPPSVKE